MRHLGGSLKGAAKAAATKVNKSFIIGEREAMRGRLVQAAVAGTLMVGGALLEGFCSETGVDVDVDEQQVDIDALDDDFEVL